MITIRNFKSEDAVGISDLFREVYADRYVYFELYVPRLIEWRNRQGYWFSAVAIYNNCIIGHASLWRDERDETNAEMAMFATHPSMRNIGIATKLGQHLLEQARKQHLTTLTIKMVSSHTHSQRLAKNLGFQTTALLRDYVRSPFTPDNRESVILGVLALEPRPIAFSSKTQQLPEWLCLLGTQFGEAESELMRVNQAQIPLEITENDNRIEVTIQQVWPTMINEIGNLPNNRLIYLRLKLKLELQPLLSKLYKWGYRDTGLIPDKQGGWFWLLQRGFSEQILPFSCPVAQALQQASLMVESEG